MYKYWLILLGIFLTVHINTEPVCGAHLFNLRLKQPPAIAREGEMEISLSLETVLYSAKGGISQQGRGGGGGQQDNRV
jgi:hypothetical protein